MVTPFGMDSWDRILGWGKGAEKLEGRWGKACVPCTCSQCRLILKYLTIWLALSSQHRCYLRPGLLSDASLTLRIWVPLDTFTLGMHSLISNLLAKIQVREGEKNLSIEGPRMQGVWQAIWAGREGLHHRAAVDGSWEIWDTERAIICLLGLPWFSQVLGCWEFFCT